MSRATDGVLKWCDTELILLPERAVWWPERQTLFIADPHFGKAATFRAAAVPLPDGTAADLQRLDAIVQSTQARTLIVLGDLLHARQGRCPAVFECVRAWRQQQRHLSLQLVIGNHDRRAGQPPAEWDMECVDEPSVCPPFQLRHYPDLTSQQPSLAGHLHPKIKVQAGGDRILSPCFLLRQQCLVLPAFGGFIDHQVIAREPGDAYFVIAENEICRVTYK